jgi:excisionase family DNA binding protein
MTEEASGRGKSERLLTPGEVARMFRVDPKTVTRWAKAGKLSSIRTLGGHRRYSESQVRRLLDQSRTVPQHGFGNRKPVDS